jgi:drug/metabolite transporter (DMT)-like permease
MTDTPRSYLLGLVFVSGAVLAWSTAGAFARLIASDAPTILFWRGFFGAVGTAMLMAVLPARHGIASFRTLGRSGLSYALLTSVSMVCFVTALLNTTVAHVAVITAIVPFVAAFLGWCLLGERPGRSAILSSAAAVAGVALMVSFGTEGRLAGDILAVMMTLGMAGMILVSRRWPAIPALAATCLASALSAAFALPFADIAAVPAFDLGVLAAFALVNQVMGFGLFALGARLLPPMETALLTTLEAPLAPLWVWLCFAETPSGATLVGAGIVLAAVAGHIWSQTRR